MVEMQIFLYFQLSSFIMFFLNVELFLYVESPQHAH